ncbi:alpha/beta-Hydrolases protein [Dioscorea alata]|uniref:Alpha/beta-Hydrolases protein n=3 Tax=Dioscorea alata TaxID=55571 RepID=A0ACB7UT29_DIOAL|nr:alpha/beta-Hydrolases protein [Dioscorea alata]KAH7663806.1 alpha/beta-Hydrolases protein [Dioscorea alata]KAH7663807.1 alpha/beta-Hydrolases protein [Dioscorea alata]
MAKTEDISNGTPKNEVKDMVSEATGFGKVEDISPDLLKNTPSNISRLEDVIEHSKGRQKYLARTKSPSDGEDVRWYFCKATLMERELAASVPRTEIVGKSDYFRFGMRDSLALEASFLQREEELLSHWWKEYSECSEGPNGSRSAVHDATNYGCDGLHSVEEERVGVPVKGGLYEVDLIKRHCFPVYWHGENRRVLRGHWFALKGGLDWLPLREDVAEQLELAYRHQVWHRRTFQPSGLFAARVDLQGTKLGLHALFTGEDDTWEAWLVYENSAFVLNVGRGIGIKLRRGFSSSGSQKPTQDELRQQKEEEIDDYCSQVPVGHLVFMVHGIGQRLEKANLVDDVGDFRRITASLAERHLTPYQRCTQRVLYIPCQWRRGLKLSGESAVEKITLDGVRGLRMTLSATVHDVLYYMSPIYCQAIVDSVSNQLNRLYIKFIKRNPGYNGKVSIYGHSLGSVLSYDILCHQHNLYSFPMESVYMGDAEGSSLQDESNKLALTTNVETSQNSNNKINDISPEQLESAVVEASSIRNRNPMPNEENSLGISPTTDSCWKEELRDHSNACSASDCKEGLAVPGQLAVDGKQINNLTLVEAGAHAVEICEEEKGGELNLNMIGTINHGEVTVNNASESKIDRDKLIVFLEEEVNSLKARIAELEQKHQSKMSIAEEENGSEKSSLKKFSTDQNPSKTSYTPYIKYTKLAFKVDTFFAVGSPLGVFLALRNVRIGIGRGQDYWQDERICEEMPRCRQMFNIFHPFDPVAYRIEPLVCKEYISKRPVIIPYHRGGKRLHIGFQEFTEELAAHSQAVANHLKSVQVKVVNIFRSKNKNDIDAAVEDEHNTEKSYGSIMIEKLTGSEDGRIDHVLQDKTFQHPYISALGSHTNYWRDPDTALFILKHLYRDIPEEPDSPGQSDAGCGSRKQNRPAGLYFDRDDVDEDLPLTFSDHLMIREFSRKAKKAMTSG